MRDTIDLFMWGYQRHFRHSLLTRTNDVLQLLGADCQAKALLVGVQSESDPGRHPVCVEPEDEEWPLALFSGLRDEAEEKIPVHPLQGMFYGDAATNRDKPANIRRSTITEAVRRRLGAADQASGVRTFCGLATLVEGYYVVCALQLPAHLFERFPSVTCTANGQAYDTSLLLRCADVLLAEGQRALLLPEPGRMVHDDGMRSASEIVRAAASSFMRSPFLGDWRSVGDLFGAFERLSQALYEGTVNLGRIVLAASDDPNVEYLLRLRRPVSLSQPRWARKLLQMSDRDVGMVSDGLSIFGLGQLTDVSPPAYCVDFLDRQQWDFRRGDQVLLRSRFGQALLPQEPIGQERFKENMRRVFPGIRATEVARFAEVLAHLVEFRRGSLVVIASDAAEEARRLAPQATVIEPVSLSRELITRATEIDGALLVSPDGLCHAVGVILDGVAKEEAVSSRGSRYNSAARYVMGSAKPRMAFVVSHDRSLDVIPLLKPRVSRRALGEAVDALCASDNKSYHKARSFLDDHRFYLAADQCERVNAALDRIESAPREVGQIVVLTGRFEPDPAMSDEYLTD